MILNKIFKCMIQALKKCRSEIRALKRHVRVGADPRSGVYPTEPGGPGRNRNATQELGRHMAPPILLGHLGDRARADLGSTGP